MTALHRLAASALVSLLAFAASGCAADDGFPDPPYFEECTSDEACGPLYQCLPFGSRDVCTLPCTSVSECPSVTSCGDVTRCQEGICTFAGCV